MRDLDTIDSELRHLAAVRRSIREHGGEPSSSQADELLDERLAHLRGPARTWRSTRSAKRAVPHSTQRMYESYNVAVAERRDDFPNNFVGDLVRTERGWVVVPPTCCPDGHAYSDPGWSVSSVWCTCNDRHMERRCVN